MLPLRRLPSPAARAVTLAPCQAPLLRRPSHRPNLGFSTPLMAPVALPTDYYLPAPSDQPVTYPRPSLPRPPPRHPSSSSISHPPPSSALLGRGSRLRLRPPLPFRYGSVRASSAESSVLAPRRAAAPPSAAIRTGKRPPLRFPLRLRLPHLLLRLLRLPNFLSLLPITSIALLRTRRSLCVLLNPPRRPRRRLPTSSPTTPHPTLRAAMPFCRRSRHLSSAAAKSRPRPSSRRSPIPTACFRPSPSSTPLISKLQRSRRRRVVRVPPAACEMSWTPTCVRHLQVLPWLPSRQCSLPWPTSPTPPLARGLRRLLLPGQTPTAAPLHRPIIQIRRPEYASYTQQ